MSDIKLPAYKGDLSVLKLVSTNEVLPVLENLVGRIQVDNAAGKFAEESASQCEALAQASAMVFVKHFAT